MEAGQSDGEAVYEFNDDIVQTYTGQKSISYLRNCRDIC